LFSQDKALSDFVEKAYIRLLEASYTINSENIKEIPYGVTLKTGKSEDKLVSVAIYHTEKKGFSVVTNDPEIKSLLLSLITNIGTLGSDEAGKGDVFGPLVVCSFLLGKKEEALMKLGAKDSKRMKNEEILDIYEKINADSRDSFSMVRIMPERYNSFYQNLSEQGKNLTDLLAWAHSKAIANVVAKRDDIKRVLVDKFTTSYSANARIIAAAGKNPVNFQVRAEQDPAVAIASVIARAGYLISLNQISETVLENKFRLVPGSGAESDKIMEEVVAHFGKEILEKIAKIHFANCERIFS
jgi:ribonuclease HIII